MRHITATHAGQTVDEPMRALLGAVERVTCIDTACGGFRRVGARACNRCSQPSQVRPPRVGDVIPGPASALSTGPPTDGPSQAITEATQQAAHQTELHLPQEFTTRVQRLPSHTLLHIPKSLRLRLLRITTECLNGAAQGSPSYAAAEEGRSKLLLGSIPRGMSAADEVSARVDLWEARQFEALPQRVEQHTIIARKAATTKKHAKPDTGAKAKRAKHVAAEGAYRKATNGLTSDMLSASPEQDQEWASLLLPTNSDPTALSTRPMRDIARNAEVLDAIEGAAAYNADDSPLKGVRFATLTAPGPSGTRPEHISDMLAVPRKADANRLLKALARFQAAVNLRSLPDEMRWITRTRLCWQRNKSG